MMADVITTMKDSGAVSGGGKGGQKLCVLLQPSCQACTQPAYDYGVQESESGTEDQSYYA